MSTTADISTVYQRNLEALKADLKKLKKKKDLIAWGRFFLLMAAVAVFFYVRPYGIGYALLASTLPMAAFIRLIVLSATNNEIITNTEQLLLINREELEVLNGNYTHRPQGIEHLPPVHEYAQDLDIFGRASLYQYINRTTSEQGAETLASWLLHTISPEQIRARQDAAKELAPRYQWRQQLQAFGAFNPVTI